MITLLWMILIILRFGIAFIVFEISTVVHEISHYLMCRVLKCRVIGLKILCFYYDGRHWSLQLQGKNHCAFISDNKKKMKLIILAGPVMELVIVTGLYILSIIVKGWVADGIRIGIVFIIVSVIYDLLPIGNGDGKLLFKKD